jgi:hypothetical protein
MFYVRWLAVNCGRATKTRWMMSILAACFGAVINAGSCFAQFRENAVEFHSGNFRKDVSDPNGLVAELRSLTHSGHGSRVVLSQTSGTDFRDDGQGYDERASDGVYTGVVPGDLDAEEKRYNSLVEQLDSASVPFFSGQRLVRYRPGSDFVRRQSDTHLPIVEVSGGTNVRIENSIAITDLSVVEAQDYTYNPCSSTGNPNGVWTFGHLMTELANAQGTNVSDFCLNWLEHWTADQVVNGFTAPERTVVRDEVINAWPVDNNGDLSMPDAPFRLLGIFNRVDLRESSYTQGSSAGEIRFVYCFTDGCSPSPRPFLVIFEYRVNKVGCDVQTWGQQWAALSELQLGSPEYLDLLSLLTTEITDVYSLQKQGLGHRLAQLRTNEFLSRPWELREFVLPGTGFLVQKSVNVTPDLSQNVTSWLANVINAGPLPPAAPTFPPSEEGAASLNPVQFFWEAPGISSNHKRHLFSLNTCNACHGRETLTDFTHVKEAPFGTPAPLSGFLTGISVPDPVDGTVRDFNDLERRRQDLQNLIDTPCLSQLLSNARRGDDKSH